MCEIVYAQGVDFRKSSFSQILSEAKEQGKMIFVDCYTSWCGPCKFMADSIFTQKPVGEYFEKHFISVKYDMEKEEADEFRNLYLVKSFPTFWIFSSNGEVLYRMSGLSRTAEDWLDRINNALVFGKKLENLRQNYQKNKSKKNWDEYFNALEKIHFEEGICSLFIDRFNDVDDKIDYLYANKGLISKYLSSESFQLFLEKLKKCEGYVSEMDEIFKNQVF